MRVAILLALLAGGAFAGETRYIVLVTADGLRWQEFFHGIDPLLAHEKAAGMEKAEDRRRKYERPTDRERREALMPFFWTRLAPKAAVFGNAKVTNRYRVSYPGYSEILTGHSSDDVIKGNDPIRNPNETVLEFFKRKLSLAQEQIALFASWELFRHIGEHTEGSIFINDGYRALDHPRTPRLAELSSLQFHVLSPWDDARHDYITGAMALEYQRVVKPRVLFVSFDETDDWAHGHRYDRVLDSIAEFDGFLGRLWNQIESMKEYRGHTTLIITCDHGRGSTVSDWSDHGPDVAGADRIWLAVTGPDTKPGEPADPVEQRDITPTMIRLMGLNPSDFPGVTGKPIAAVLPAK
jgi:hypothetical protein